MILANNDFPFIRLVSSDSFRLGETGSIEARFVNTLGQNIKVEDSKLKAVQFYFYDGDSVDVTAASSLDKSTGLLTVKISESTSLVKGSFYVDVTLASANGETTRLSTTEHVKVQTNYKMDYFAYEVHNQKQATQALLIKKPATVWPYPGKVTDLEQERGTDDTYLHFKASVALVDSKGATIGHPDQLYLALKKVDSQQD